MKHLWVRLCGIFLLAGCQSVDVVQEGGFRVGQALHQNQPVPVLSRDYGKAFTEDNAYRIQRLALEQTLRGQRPAGFKAEQVAGAESVAGVLLPGGEIAATEDGYTVLLKSFRKPVLQVELGYRLTRRVNAPLPDVAALQELVGEIAPVIELPDLVVAGGEAPTPRDLIATNVGAKRFLVGAGRAPSLNDPNRIHLDLYREGEAVTSADARTVGGDQWRALLWLVNRTVATGWAIEPGQLLLTGPIGKPAALQVGLYVADFGPFARLEFNVE